MKRFLVLIILALMCGVTASSSQSKKTGIGIVLGSPTGFSIKHWNSQEVAYQGAIGGGFGGLRIGADYLIHSNAFNNAQLPFYYGPGAFLGPGGFGGRKYQSGDLALGGRFMFGVNYLFPEHPFDFAVEVGPSLLLAPFVDVYIELGIAFRFYP
ncbi:MAG: hypothetical protein ACRDGA_06365 [Bacteroidota bacterium]